MKHWQQVTQEELKKYVPDPDGEIERLQEQLKETQQELQIRINDNADMYAKLCNVLMQLEEANQIIKWYNSLENLLIDGGWQLLTGQKKGTAEKYLKKWRVE